MRNSYIWVSVNDKGEWNYVICRKMDVTGDCYIKWIKPDSEKKNPDIVDSSFYMIPGF